MGLAFLSLPFVKIQISIKSSGLLQSSQEKTELTIPVNGRLIQLNIKDNQRIKKGDTLLTIDAALPRQQDALVQTRIVQIGQLLQDINRLLTSSSLNTPNLQTGQYNASWQQFLQESENMRNAKEQAERTFKRYEKLHQNGAITASEYEKYKFEYDQANSANLLLSKKYRSQWQVEASQYRNELRQLAGQQAELNERKKQYILKAPISGSLQNIAGLQNGAYVFANQRIGEISPDTKLLAFCYIKPSDIGLIRKGQEVRLQVDAFNYNQWGLASGKVLDISDDIIVLNNNQPVFKVKCSLDKNHLQLKNGYKGYLKKGMNFTARFSVAERSLYQLLFDKVDDWVNPNLI
ncbi:MAG: HlyD family secretion protein [Daejeonella sp.]